jgi:tartrate dehydratase alpha subunit/fumarate hydratase class I-like protein
MITIIKQDDLIESMAVALQCISYYHPVDYIQHLARTYEYEQSPAARDAIAQILTNSRMCAEGKRPICQDTGIVNVFLKIGMEAIYEFDVRDMPVTAAVDSNGVSVHNTGPKEWQECITKDSSVSRIPVSVA